jgi:hypothetical protein
MNLGQHELEGSIKFSSAIWPIPLRIDPPCGREHAAPQQKNDVSGRTCVALARLGKEAF